MTRNKRSISLSVRSLAALRSFIVSFAASKDNRCQRASADIPRRVSGAGLTVGDGSPTEWYPDPRRQAAHVCNVLRTEMMGVSQMAMLAALPYTTLRAAVFAHLKIAEGLGSVFGNVPVRAS